MEAKEKFIEIYTQNIHREGSDKLLEYLCSDGCDFFDAPASTRFHGANQGGLVQHSVNVYECLTDYLSRERAKNLYHMNYTDESVATVALLHDICKVGIYRTSYRNVKDENGVWNKVPFYEMHDELPYGHGEKSVYVISGFMRLSREEAFAIRYHMGFSGIEDKRDIGYALENFPLAMALNVADMEASYFMESNCHK